MAKEEGYKNLREEQVLGGKTNMEGGASRLGLGVAVPAVCDETAGEGDWRHGATNPVGLGRSS